MAEVIKLHDYGFSIQIMKMKHFDYTTKNITKLEHAILPKQCSISGYKCNTMCECECIYF